MLNKVVLMGRLVADPVVNQTTNGTHISTIRIAVARNYVKKGEERKSDFFDIVLWRHLADFVSSHFKKASLIVIEGYLENHSYEGKDGQRRYKTQIVAEKAMFVERPSHNVNNILNNNTSSDNTPVILSADSVETKVVE